MLSSNTKSFTVPSNMRATLGDMSMRTALADSSERRYSYSDEFVFAYHE